MCLSPEVDLAVGAAMTVIGVDALRHVPFKAAIPLAAAPLLFASHSVASALVWCGFLTSQPAWITHLASDYFIGFAFVFLPIYVPIAVALIEPQRSRRIAMWVTFALGVIAGFDFLQSVVMHSNKIAACTYYIDYGVHPSNEWTGMFYFLATCGVVLLSSHRPMLWWGLVNLIAVGALNFEQREGLPSLWCFWAAATSWFVAWLMRNLKHSGVKSVESVSIG